MDKTKRKKLEAAGWKIGSAEEFLGLGQEEAAFVEVKLTLSEELRELRAKRGLSQVELAKRLGSSQSRVAKMEGSDPTVSIDLLIKGLLAMGATKGRIAKAIGREAVPRARKARARRSAV